MVLRLPQPDDVRAVQMAIAMTLPELARWMPRAAKGQTQAQTRAYIYTQMALFVQDETLSFGMFGRESGACLGMVELSSSVPRIPSWELAFWTRSDVAGQGLMSEAAGALLDFARDKLRARRVFLRCEPENLGARRVARKIGLLEEGCLKNDALGVHGEPVDTMIYGVSQ